jgi:hypothetical protein
MDDGLLRYCSLSETERVEVRVDFGVVSFAQWISCIIISDNIGFCPFMSIHPVIAEMNA